MSTVSAAWESGSIPQPSPSRTASAKSADAGTTCRGGSSGRRGSNRCQKGTWEGCYGGWEDLRNRVGSTVLNNSVGNSFDRYAEDNLKIQAVPSIQQSFEKLLRGRADYVIYERYQGLALAQQMGLTDQIDILDGSLMSEQLYFTLSHNSACHSPEMRAALAQAMLDLARSDEPKQLLEEYREVWARQLAPITPTSAPAIIE